ncbi:MAG: depupylase/deamidase Dop [Marmoricola sp.]
MTVKRVMGTETEFGISVQGMPRANPVVASGRVVNSYASSLKHVKQARWDYEEESPLRDARGFDMSRQVADASQLTDEDNGLANLILTNGARLYVDHAHPEYSSPEVTNPRDAVIWDKAGELIALEACRLAADSGQTIVLYKNNTDNKGVSYGSHENYLVQRATPFADLVRYLTSFFVSRQVVCGAGRVGIGQDGNGHGFQLTQRADFFEVEVGLETTLKRPIINTRDEPHADPDRYRRLHVIIGDANLAETSIYLKVGTTALMLAMIEDGFLTDPMTLATPVASLRAVSHDPTLKHQVELTDGRSMTALQMQWEFHNTAAKYVAHKYGYDVDAPTRDVLSTWESVLTKLERDPMECANELDWVAKLQLLESYRERDGLDWDSAKLALVDLQYSDLRPERGLYQRLVARGRMKRIVTDEEIARAVTEPPEDTRAYFRGRCLAKFPEEIAAASWDSVIFDVPGHSTLQRIPTGDPLRGTKAHVGNLIDNSSSGQALIEALTR